MNRRLARRTFLGRLGAGLGIAASGVTMAVGSAGRLRAAARQAVTGAALNRRQGALGRSDASRQATPAAPSGTVGLSYVDGSTVKIEQAIGDFDKQLQQPTVNQTASRYGIIGTDLGNSFEHQGNVYFLFGDTIASGAPDPMGWSDSTDPNGPLQLDFLSAAPGSFIPVKAPGVSMGPFEVPGAGLSLNGVLYVAVLTNYTPDRSTYTSLLLRFDERSHSFSRLREISHRPNGHFINMTMRLAPDGTTGLPSSDPYVLLFGSGDYRKSNAYLAAVPVASFESGANTGYFAGMNGDQPVWTDTDDGAAPIVTHPVIGELGVIFQPDLGLWLMTYNSSDPRGIILRYAAQPWGPWSDAIVIFNPERDQGWGYFIHDPRIVPDDGLDGPVTTGNPGSVLGGDYAPYVIERFTSVQDDTLTLHYLMSTWNPYTVVRMRATLAIVRY